MRFGIVGLGRIGANVARSAHDRSVIPLVAGYGGHPLLLADERLVRG
jgi:lactate dehydrogenase-like 2-hydroxyacid dehydrogenase